MVNLLGSMLQKGLAAHGLSPYSLRIRGGAQVSPNPVLYPVGHSGNQDPTMSTGPSEQTWQYGCNLPNSEVERLADSTGSTVSALLTPGSEWEIRELSGNWVAVTLVRDPISNGAFWVLTFEIPRSY